METNLCGDPETGEPVKDLMSLYDRYSGPLFGVLLHLTADRKKAELLLQQSFHQGVLHWSSYNATSGRCFSWLLRITLSLAGTSLGLSKAEILGRLRPLLDCVGKLDLPRGTRKNLENDSVDDR
ncbi:MAG: hypothetical protein EOP49_23950 [Sphingobacteriales bacterium]|nr:MAG: hypothetical protein EOP49_23950 [Sphingobacteriales bacterium]